MLSLREQARIQKQVKSAIANIRHTCFFPGCTNHAINCHSQQKSTSLNSISKYGYVYGYNPCNYHLIGEDEALHGPKICKVNIAHASTFLGFCSKHDFELFRLIDQDSYSTGCTRQEVAYYVRAIAHEMYQKRMSYLRQTAFDKAISNEYPLTRPSDNILAKHFKLFQEKLYRLIFVPAVYYGASGIEYESRVLSLPFNVGFSCATVWGLGIPTKPDDVRFLDSSIHGIASVTILPSEGLSTLIITWKKTNDRNCGDLVDKMISENTPEEMFDILAFSLTEDTYISPNVYGQMSPIDMRNWRENLIPKYHRPCEIHHLQVAQARLHLLGESKSDRMAPASSKSGSDRRFI